MSQDALVRWPLAKVDADWPHRVAAGDIPGYKLIHKFGRNDAVPNGTWEFVSTLSVPAYPAPVAATAVRIKAGGNAADTAAGAGAQSITVVGLDSTLVEAEAVIATAGAAASASTATLFWRVYRAWVSGVGTYGAANTGPVIIENGAGTLDMISIAADEGQTQFGGFAVPTNTRAYILSITLTVDALKAADLRLFQRLSLTTVAGTMASKRLMQHWDGVLGVHDESFPGGKDGLLGPCDIWFEARGSGAITEVSVAFTILLVDE